MPEIQPWHKTELLEPDYTRVDLVKEGANSQAHIKLFKGKGGEQMTYEDFISKLKPEQAAIVTTHIEKLKSDMQVELDTITKAKTDAETALQTAEEVNKVKDANSPEEILKTVKDPAVKALLETQIAKAAAAEEMVRKAHEATVESESIAKAKELPSIGASDDQLTAVFKKLSTVDSALGEEVFGILKAANALASEGGAFTAVGKSAHEADGAGSEGDAWALIEKASEAHITKGVSKASAISKAIQENPALYKQYLEAQRA